MRMELRILLLALAVLAVSCASSSELARRADRALQQKDFEKAYKEARASLDKDFSNARAREALSAAADVLIRRRQQDVLSVAAYDTLEAGERLLDLRGFVDEVRRYDAELPMDTEFNEAARRIRQGAAGQLYTSGRAYEDAGEFRQAYRTFESAVRFVPGYSDLGMRMPAVFEQALIRVAVVPFLDETGLPLLARELDAQLMAELARPLGETRFTELIPGDQVRAQMESGEEGDLSRDRAVVVGKAAGADVVVWGRLRGLRSDHHVDHYHGHLYRKTSYQDTSGVEVDRYHEVPFDATHRRREVVLRWESEAIDIATGGALLRDGDEAKAWARTVYSDFDFDGDAGDYCLYPPELRQRDWARCDRLDDDWKEVFGRWSVPKFLEQAREHHDRRRYQSGYRGEFRRQRGDDPFYLDDLPVTSDLALLALGDVPARVLTGLRKLEDR
jgi:tetratricopeptide (TPR) repeat protein